MGLLAETTSPYYSKRSLGSGLSIIQTLSKFWGAAEAHAICKAETGALIAAVYL